MDENELIQNQTRINLTYEYNEYQLTEQNYQNKSTHANSYNQTQKQLDCIGLLNQEKNIIYQKQILSQISMHNQQFGGSMNNNKMSNFQDLIEKNLTRIAFRCFFNRFMTYYIKSLKYQQEQIRKTSAVQIRKLKEQNWPFKDLYYKKIRNPDDQMMFQFINMCAQKIQSVFKGYIQRKRHFQALKRINKFKKNLSNAVKSWKFWNIFNCKRVIELRSIVRSIDLQIQREISNSNIDRNMKKKKIQYLHKNEEIAKLNFRTIFFQLYQSGAWIFEIQKCFKTDIFKNKFQKSINFPVKYTEIKENLVNQKALNRRIRQFQAPYQKNKEIQRQEIDLLENKPNINHNKSMGLSTNFQSISQQRPIVSKGQYKFDQLNDNEFLNASSLKNQKKVDIQNKQPQQYLENQQKKIGALQERKKLNKRQKYDPRKAIEQEKRKKIQNKNNGQDKNVQKNQTLINEKTLTSNLHSKTPTKISKKTPIKVKKEEKRLESPHEQSKQKTVQKIKKQNKLTKKDDNSKSLKNIFNPKKVASKVDCWGSKKDNSFMTQNPTNEESSYRSKYLVGLKQKNEGKSVKMHDSQKDLGVNRLRNRFKKSYQSRQQQSENEDKQQKYKNQSNEETFKSSYLKRLVQERQKGSFSYTNKGTLNIRIAERIRQPQKAIPDKYEPPTNITNTRRISVHYNDINNQKNNISQKIQKKIQNNNSNFKKKQESHRPIQSLEEVYSSQYTDRYNNLKSKLNMLESTRYIQRDGSIPIILSESKFIQKIFNSNEHSFSSLYWPQVRTMQTNFLEYIKFNITSGH